MLRLTKSVRQLIGISGFEKIFIVRERARYEKIKILVLMSLFLTLTGCISVPSLTLTPLAEESSLSPVVEKNDIEEYVQRKITTAMAASEKAEPETYNLNNKQLYECTADFGRGISGKYVDKAYVLSGVNGSVLLHQSNPNLYFSTKNQVVDLGEKKGGLRLFTPNYKPVPSILDGSYPCIGGVNYKCELSSRKDLFRDDINGIYDITYSMSYDRMPLAITTVINSMPTTDNEDTQAAELANNLFYDSLTNYAIFGSPFVGDSMMINMIFSKIEETKAYNKTKAFSCKLVEGQNFSYGIWPHKVDIKGKIFEIKATKDFVYFKNSETSSKIDRNNPSLNVRIVNVNDLLVVIEEDSKTKDVLQKVILDCGI